MPIIESMVRLGSDLLLSSSRLKGTRVGVVCNHASVDRGFAHIVDRLAAADGVTLAAIFGPQHGFRSDVQDNMIETPHARRPGAAGADLLALQRDARADRRDAAAARRAGHRPAGHRRAHLHLHLHDGQLPARLRRGIGVPVIVCDRPNPIGGVDVEGAALVPGFESFVGQFPIPMRHGMTIGELARLFNEAFRHRRAARGRADGRLAARHVRRRRPACRG